MIGILILDREFHSKYGAMMIFSLSGVFMNYTHDSSPNIHELRNWVPPPKKVKHTVIHIMHLEPDDPYSFPTFFSDFLIQKTCCIACIYQPTVVFEHTNRGFGARSEVSQVGQAVSWPGGGWWRTVTGWGGHRAPRPFLSTEALYMGGFPIKWPKIKWGFTGSYNLKSLKLIISPWK